MKNISIFFALIVLSSPAFASDGNIEGELRDKSGRALTNTEVRLQDGQGGTMTTAISDANGRYALHSIAAGSYVILVTQKDAVLGSATISIKDAETTHKDITLTDQQVMNVVIAHRQQARNDISSRTGTNSYSMNQKAIESLPQADNTPLDKILAQTPGVAEDSSASGGIHLRGEHANLQYRLNGILLPDGIGGFSDSIDPHIIDNAQLLDGTLPAQYGFRTAGVVDITTKNGFQDSGTFNKQIGSHNTFQPSVSYGSRFDNTDYFAALSHVSSDLGIENPTRSHEATHDHSEQNKQFVYASTMISPEQRVGIVAGNSISYFQIPNNPNQSTTYKYNGISSFNSSNLNERQFESNQFVTTAWQAGSDGVEVQIVPFIRSSELHFRPDMMGDLLFNGVASDVMSKDLATGLQSDNSWRINGDHTLRGGLTLQNNHVQNNSTSLAFQTSGSTPLVDGSGNNLLTSPIINNHTKDGQLYGLYLQDEWKITDDLTMNYGVRYDDMEQYVSADQLSPRMSLVYKATETTTLHAGYARYFTPPPMQLVSNADLNGFADTTNAPQVMQNGAVKPERSNNFDVGATQKLGERWQIGIDGYYKLVHDLLDEGQFGQALIMTPFNYQHGYIYGSEFTATYTGNKLKAYGNFAFSRAMGENIVSGQFNFSDPAELSYISNHYVHLDHDQTFTASAGASYDVLSHTTAGIDGNFGSGLRAGYTNTSHLPAYVTFNASIEQKLDLIPHNETAVRLSIINVLDSAYELRSGTGIGVGAPQWGARRGVFISVAQKF